MIIVGVYVVSGLQVENTSEVASKCGQRRQWQIVFQTICGEMRRCWDWYVLCGVSAALRCWSRTPSVDEIRIRPLENRGFGCSGEPGKSNMMISDTDIVKTPSTAIMVRIYV